jgi:hypothetical protein
LISIIYLNPFQAQYTKLAQRDKNYKVDYEKEEPVGKLFVNLTPGTEYYVWVEENKENAEAEKVASEVQIKKLEEMVAEDTTNIATMLMNVKSKKKRLVKKKKVKKQVTVPDLLKEDAEEEEGEKNIVDKANGNGDGSVTGNDQGTEGKKGKLEENLPVGESDQVSEEEEYEEEYEEEEEFDSNYSEFDSLQETWGAENEEEEVSGSEPPPLLESNPNTEAVDLGGLD